MAKGKKTFLMAHRKDIIQNLREPIQLADDLLEKNHIQNEMYNNIKYNATKQDKTRDIFGCLNSKAHYDGFYDWLKENESDMLEELGKASSLHLINAHKYLELTF